MESVQGVMMLMPPPEGHCRICAMKHDPNVPHNGLSLFYGMRFKMRYGREGTWADAIAHCDEQTQEFWKLRLIERGAWTEPAEGIDPIKEPIDG